MIAFEEQEGLTPLTSLAELAVSELNNARLDGRPLDADLIDEISAVLHEEWLKDNSMNGIPDEKNHPYGELSEENKEEYRTVVRVTAQKLKNIMTRDSASAND